MVVTSTALERQTFTSTIKEYITSLEVKISYHSSDSAHTHTYTTLYSLSRTHLDSTSIQRIHINAQVLRASSLLTYRCHQYCLNCCQIQFWYLGNISEMCCCVKEEYLKINQRASMENVENKSRSVSEGKVCWTTGYSGCIPILYWRAEPQSESFQRSTTPPKHTHTHTHNDATYNITAYCFHFSIILKNSSYFSKL